MKSTDQAADFRAALSQFLPAGEAGRITYAVLHGKGSWYWDAGGRKHLDFTSGIFTNSFGHGDVDIARAFSRTFEQLGNIHGRHWAGEPEVYRKLFSYLPPGEYRVIPYGDGGGYSVDRAEVELYYHFQKRRYRLVTFDDGFHGKTQGTKLSISRTQDSAYFCSKTIPEPNCFNCPCHLKRGECAMECASLAEQELERFDADVFLFEPILGAGIVVPPEGFWPRLQAFCRRHGILMMADEVLTGGGRTGEFFASAAFGLSPDILIVTKGLANGLPLSLMFLKKPLTENDCALREGNYSSTFMGVPALLATLGEVLDKIEREHILENVKERGAQLLTGLFEIKARHPCVGDARGIGLMAAMEFISPDSSPDILTGRAVCAAAEHNGLALIQSGSTVRIAPPLNVSANEIAIGLELLENSISEVEK